MSDEEHENLHERRYAIKFCVKLKKVITEMKEMLDAVYNESAMSEDSVYCWYELKNVRKGVELIGGPAPMAALTKQSTLVQQ